MEKGRILVVDDELVICKLLTDVLGDKGYSVRYTQSGIAGLETMAKDNFDVIIADLKMPDMDGMELLREIKLKEDPDAVVIMITGYASLESAQHALRLGAYDYITKPFETDKICFTVRRAVASKRLMEANKELLRQLEQEKAKLERRVRDRVSEAEFVLCLGREISSTLELNEILRHTVDALTEKLGLTRCVILLSEDISGELSISYARGLNKEVIEKTKLKKGEKISGWTMKQSSLIYAEDVNADPRFAQREQERYYTGGLVSIPLMVKNEVIGVINANNKKSGEKFTDSDLRLFKEITAEVSIAVENSRLYKKLQQVYMHTIKALSSLIDAKDHYTKTHSEQVTKYAVAIAKQMRLSPSQVETIKQASQLHDLGKMGIHDYILTKPRKLTPGEWEEVKLHALKGAEILEPLNFMKGVSELIKQHHERYDGKGYPYGYKQDQIKLGARIMAAADAYDAMISERAYRKAFSKEEAIKELRKNSGSQFDPQVIKAFLGVLKKERHK